MSACGRAQGSPATSRQARSADQPSWRIRYAAWTRLVRWCPATQWKKTGRRAGSASKSAASAICSSVALDPRIGTMIHPVPARRTTSSCSRYLGSSRLMAVSVTIVLIPSLRIIRRNGPGLCQAPRTSPPSTT